MCVCSNTWAMAVKKRKSQSCGPNGCYSTAQVHKRKCMCLALQDNHGFVMGKKGYPGHLKSHAYRLGAPRLRGTTNKPT